MTRKDVPRGTGPWPRQNDVRSVQHWLSQRLGISEEREAESVGRLLLDHVSGISRSERIAEGWRANESDLEQLALLADRIGSGEPVQYALGITHFFGLDFVCDRRALIPRPETEELLAEALNRVRAVGQQTLRVLDIGTGTGILPIAWKSNRPQDEVHGIDIESAALALASDNAARNGVEVRWHQIDALADAALAALTVVPFDVVLSNPPYIPRAEAPSMSETVCAWEPDSALFVADDDPLVFYRRIVQGCLREGWLTEGGWLAMECHRDGTEAVLDLIPEHWPQRTRLRDLQGNWRMVLAQAPAIKG